MADIVALAQGDAPTQQFWHFYDIDNARRYWFHKPAGRPPVAQLRCTVYRIPTAHKESSGHSGVMEGFLVLEDDDALALLNAMRVRCGLSEKEMVERC